MDLAWVAFRCAAFYKKTLCAVVILLALFATALPYWIQGSYFSYHLTYFIGFFLLFLFPLVKALQQGEAPHLEKMLIILVCIPAIISLRVAAPSLVERFLPSPHYDSFAGSYKHLLVVTKPYEELMQMVPRTATWATLNGPFVFVFRRTALNGYSMSSPVVTGSGEFSTICRV